MSEDGEESTETEMAPVIQAPPDEFPIGLTQFSRTLQPANMAQAFCRVLLAENPQWEAPRMPSDWTRLFVKWRRKPSGIASGEWLLKE